MGRLLIAKPIPVSHHFRTGSLIDTGIRLGLSDDPEKAKKTADIYIKSLRWTFPTGRHKHLSGEVINFVRPRFLKRDPQGFFVPQVPIDDFKAMFNRLEPAHRGGVTPYESPDLIALIQQILRKITSVLARYSRDEG